MSDVVIRCPNCGTTQPALGECEACHEAEARYYCPNHTPGRWLDGPACPACGARLAGRGGATTLPPAPATGGTGARRGTPPTPARTGPEPRPAPRTGPPPRVRRVPVPTPVEPEESGVEWTEVGGPAGWPPARGRRERAPWAVETPFPIVRVGVGSIVGCLGRAVFAVVVLLVLASLSFFGYCGAFPF